MTVTSSASATTNGQLYSGLASTSYASSAASSLVGGSGNDALRGDLGADVFRWEFGDAGSFGTPAKDVIVDFDPAAKASGGDVLDLRDLLQGDLTAGGQVGNLSQYLEFEYTSVNGKTQTVIHISSAGRFAGTGVWGAGEAGKEDQTITLTDVDLRTALGLTTSASDAQVLQELLNRKKLLVDGT